MFAGYLRHASQQTLGVGVDAQYPVLKSQQRNACKSNFLLESMLDFLDSDTGLGCFEK